MLSVLAVTLFMISSLNAVAGSKVSNSNTKIQAADCLDQVDILVGQADAAGWSMSELTWLSNAALAVYCYGYTWDDVYNQL